MIAYAGTYYQKLTPADDVTEPVTLDEAKNWARVDTSYTDDEISSQIVSARQDIEKITGLALVTSSALIRFNAKCDGDELTMWPYVFDTSLIDADTLMVHKLLGSGQSDAMVASTDYFFSDTLSFAAPGKFEIAYDINIETIPETLKEAIKMLVAYRINNKGDQENQQGIPEDVMSKISRFIQPVL